MNVDQTYRNRLVMQPVDEDELSALRTLWDVLEERWMTLDVGQYPDLDHDLGVESAFRPQDGTEEPGARALVVPTGVDWLRLQGDGGFASR